MVALEAIFNKATTTIDGGWNLTFSLPQEAAYNITEVAKLRDEALYLVVMTAEEYEKQQETKNRKPK